MYRSCGNGGGGGACGGALGGTCGHAFSSITLCSVGVVRAAGFSGLERAGVCAGTYWGSCSCFDVLQTQTQAVSMNVL